MATWGKTSDGRVLDDALVEQLAAQAEAGFPGVEFERPKTGRPLMDSSGPSRARTLRLPQPMDEALVKRAKAEDTTPSGVMREALGRYLATV
jgi:hypothetical protein